MKRKIAVSLFFAGVVLAGFCGFGGTALAAEFNDGRTSVGGYAEFTYIDDRGIGWSGAETTFRPRLKLDVKHDLYDDVLVRLSGEWVPSVNSYARAYSQLKRREGNPEDSYMQFTGLMGSPVTLRIGVVKVPFGFFNTLAVEDRNRPISFSRTREWDFGFRLDGALPYLDWSLAVVNGEGREGTDSNSAKSVAARIAFPSSGGDAYQETLEITGYPNPRNANPDGGFSWRAGLSGYVGNKYTTPIKQKNGHYGVDVRLDYSIFSLKLQYSYLEGGFTDSTVTDVPLDTWRAQLGYSDAVTYDLNTFRKGYSAMAELEAGITAKTMCAVMLEKYDPDSQSDAGVRQKAKTRLVAGLKHDFRPGISAAVFYTVNDDPAFGKVGDVTQSDDWKGDNVLTGTISVAF